MKLNYEQIKSITQGAVSISECENGFTFHRFNEEEEKFYAPTSHAKKVFSTAGIQMVFKTDAESISLSISVSAGSSRSYFSFDVYADGELCGEFKNFEHENMTLPYTTIECESGDFSWKLPLKKGDKTVRITFPFSVCPVISEISLDNATFVEPVRRSKTMLMYGDSITHGYDCLNSSKAYAVQLSHMLDAEAFNKAIGGEVFQPELGKIKNDISPDYITVAYGTNDWSHFSQEKLEESCRGFYQNLKNNYPDAKIFAITPIWRGDCETDKQYPFAGVYETINKVCEEIGGITVINGFDFVPHDENLYADLRLHPTDEGFCHYAKNLYNEIRKYI
ncbi:MAG: SGNH/GDSL hydrolase family protein [Ruminococcaceae bacterium]|nr:SGNH/GDSL hydrolase family protein [Oscillospiraceae bacterium]